MGCQREVTKKHLGKKKNLSITKFKQIGIDHLVNMI